MAQIGSIAQVVNGAVNWIFAADGVENFPAGPGELPDWPPCGGWSQDMLVDVTNRPEVRTGWCYDAETGTFSETQPAE